MQVEQAGKNLIVNLPQKFSLAQTLDSGQCFRWRACGESYSGIVGNAQITVSQTDEMTLVFHGVTEKEFSEFWKDYFDLERDYDSLKKIFARDATLKKAIDFCGGIRVLNQPKWETLCSYIISQNNNIPRIKSIIEKICAHFGNPVGMGVDKNFSFPAPEVLSGASVEDFQKLGLGYRAPYILGAARAVANGEICLGSVASMPINEARKELRKLLGVGPKVAECALLSGFRKCEAFPVDTWIKSVMSTFYPNGLPDFIKPQAGIAQIYLFHYARNLPK